MNSFLSGNLEFDYGYTTSDFGEQDDEVEVIDVLPSGKPSPPSSPASRWIARNKRRKVEKKKKNDPHNSNSPAVSRTNRHMARHKIVVGSRVSKRIGDVLENDITPNGNKRRAVVGGTVIESLGKQTWKIMFDDGLGEREYRLTQLKFEHNDFVYH